MYLFFDTETTGVPKNYKAPATDLENWPRVIQLAWALYDEKGVCLSSTCCLIRPNGWVMPTDKFWIDNGFSHEKSMAEGMAIESALLLFTTLLNRTKYIIAHNMAFDLPIVQAEMIKAGMKSTNKPIRFCTMQATTNICQIPGPYGFKWPKLEELHRFLFKQDFEGAHDALNDVMATAKCFFELQKNNLIQFTQ